jgi:DNA polymerase-4
MSLPRVIFHVDMDAFYAAIEVHDRPELAGLPLIVGGPQRRGVVSTASYEARRFGVRSAMSMVEAMRRCPQAIVLPVRMERYAEVSGQVMDVFDRFSPLVEPLSLDEAFLDMTGSEGLFGPPVEAARRLKAEVRDATGLTCSVGIAVNKFLAKLASELDKPDGVTVVPAGREREFLAPLPVRRLWGVGPKTTARLEALGLPTIGAIAGADPAWLRGRLGSTGEHVWRLAHAMDDRPVEPDRDRKSFGSEETLAVDVSGRAAVEVLLLPHCERVARHLRRDGVVARGVRVKVRYQDGFELATRDHRLAATFDDSDTLFREACRLLDRVDVDRPMRLIGVAAFDVAPDGDGAGQGDLFAASGPSPRSRVEHAIDGLRARIGDKVKRASLAAREASESTADGPTEPTSTPDP